MASLIHLCARLLHAPPYTLPSLSPLSSSTHLHTRRRPLTTALPFHRRPLTRLHALADSDSNSNSSPKSKNPNYQSLLQELADSLDLPDDYFANLPKDLRRHLDDAADKISYSNVYVGFDDGGFGRVSSRGVVDECGQELGQTLLDISQAWFSADTSTSHSLATKLPSLASSLADSERSAFGLRLISAGTIFQSMGLYRQGELQKISEIMISAGEALCASSSYTAPERIREIQTKTLKLGSFEFEMTPEFANASAQQLLLCGTVFWIISVAVQNVPVSSLQYVNDNVLQLAKSLRGSLVTPLYVLAIWCGLSSLGFLFIWDLDLEED